MSCARTSRWFVGSSRSRSCGFLREGACEVHPLALAAREGRVLAVGELDEPRVLEAAPHDRAVEVAGSREGAEVRRAAERDDLGDPEAGGVLHVLLGEGDDPRAFASAQRGEVAVAEARRPGIRSLDAGDEVQERALAGAVRAEERADGRAGHGAVDVVDDEPASAGEAHPVGVEGAGAVRVGHVSLRSRSMSTANTGPPTSAVTMPTGSSRGSNSVRAAVSAHTRKIAPASADSGSSARCRGSDEQPHRVREDEPDESDRAAHRHQRAREQRGADEQPAPGCGRRARRGRPRRCPRTRRRRACGRSRAAARR